MSRIGKKSIIIPNGVKVIDKNNHILIEGKHGILEKEFKNLVTIKQFDNELLIIRQIESKEGKAYHGLARALVQNMIIGVNEKFSKTLIAEGVGYKFQLTNNNLILNMGFTHPVIFEIPKDIMIKQETPTKISIIGIDKEKVGFLAAKIRNVKPPEPYKGKGILYEGEKIRRKAGKTGK
jgi:large subunit ribosomal protein L6